MCSTYDQIKRLIYPFGCLLRPLRYPGMYHPGAQQIMSLNGPLARLVLPRGCGRLQVIDLHVVVYALRREKAVRLRWWEVLRGRRIAALQGFLPGSR